jgi:hypothetical protein
MNNLILLGIMSLLLCYYLFRGIIKEGIEKKFYSKGKKNSLSSRKLIINTKEDCVEAIGKLNLDTRKWWTGDDPNVPPGCSWTDKLSLTGNSLGLWNKNLVGKRRYDLHPIHYQPPHKTSSALGFLKKINRNLFEDKKEEEIKDVPIALRMKVGTRDQIDSGKFTEDLDNVIAEGFNSGDEMINKDNGLKSQLKANTDLNNTKWLGGEDYEKRQNDRKKEYFKYKAINSLLMDVNHLRNSAISNTPVELNLKI